MTTDVKYGRTKEVRLTGQLLPFHESGQPVVLDLPGLGPSLALFATEDELRSYMSMAGIDRYRIKQVSDGPEFLESQIPYPIVCDMRYEDGKSKWNLVLEKPRG